MNSKVRALVWEECRTGGVIALATTAVGAIMLVHCRWEIGPDAWDRDPTFAGWGLFGVPLLTALLVILNPDYSGHLTGGFSRRVLRLPLTTAAAVAPALASRLVFILVSSLTLVALSAGLFEKSPGLEVALGIALFYLAAQLSDWLRRPLSGMSTLLMLVVLAEVFGRILPTHFIVAPSAWLLSVLPLSNAAIPVAAVVAPIAAYLVSVAAVNADRVGKHFGVPEVWQWPRFLSGVRSTVKKAPFRSPLAAQVWFELRRSRATLPLVAIGSCILLAGAMWLFRLGTAASTWINVSMTIWPAIALGAAAQGAITRVVGFRRTTGKPGYEMLQPMTPAEFARARSLANAIVLVLTVLIALLTQVGFAIAVSSARSIWNGNHSHLELGWADIFSTLGVFSRGLRIGAMDVREMLWVVLGRALVTGTAAWALLAIGTRTMRRALGWSLLSIVLFLWTAAEADWPTRAACYASWSFCVILVVVALASLRNALNDGLISRWTAIGWLTAWGLAAWLFNSATFDPWAEGTGIVQHVFGSVVTAVGFASLVPLGYLAVLADVRKKRHGIALPQEVASINAAGGHRGRRAARLAVGAVAAVFIVWLGWPSRPSYMDLLKRRGFPINRVELNAWYPAVPESENAATAYSKIADTANALDVKRRQSKNYKAGVEFDAKEQLTDEYWTDVTSNVAPLLRDMTKLDTTRSRYPVDLSSNAANSVDYSTGIPVLETHLRLDASHWTIAGRPDLAADDAAALVALSKSLATMPTLYPQLVRLSMVSQVAKLSHQIISLSGPTDLTLKKLQALCEEAMPDFEGMDRGTVGDAILAFSGTHIYPGYGFEDEKPAPTLYALVARSVYPVSAPQALLALQLDLVLRSHHDFWSDYRGEFSGAGHAYAAFASTFAPNAWMYGLSFGRVYETVWRAQTNLELAKTALAVERYRLAHGKIPANLEELVPDYLARAPEDHFWGESRPLRYRVNDDGTYVVYSVGQDRLDSYEQNAQRGDKIDWRRDDLRFEIPPQPVRSGGQAAYDAWVNRSARAPQNPPGSTPAR